MSTEVKASKAKSAYVPKPRKATFTIEGEKDKRIFRPVNKRAHKWAKKVGKRTKLTVENMRTIKATKRVKLYAYQEGALKAIKV